MKEAEIMVLIEEFDTLINKLDPKRQQQISFLIEKIGSRYFTAPASSAEHRHDAETGGLVAHSLEVYKNLRNLCESWFPSIPLDSIIIAGLFHDLGKIGSLDLDYYLPETEQWRLKKGYRYEINKALVDGLSHAQRSVRLLSQCGVDLKDDEYLAILYHDGLYLPENARIAKIHDSKLTAALHWADYYTAFFAETK